MASPFRNRRTLGALGAVLSLGLIGGGYLAWKRTQPPAVDSPLYKEMVSAFGTGVAALQAGDTECSSKHWPLAVKLVPQEPAAWANLGLLQLRQGQFDEAAQSLKKASELAPQNGAIAFLQGLVESRRGQSPAAVKWWRRALELDPKNLQASYSLAQEVERQGGASSEKESLGLLQGILKTQPANLAVQLEAMRLAAKTNEAATFGGLMNALRPKVRTWPSDVQEQWREVETASKTAVANAAIPVVFLTNLLKQQAEYQQSLLAVDATAGSQDGQVGQPLDRFLWMTPPGAHPAPADISLKFAAAPLQKASLQKASSASGNAVRVVYPDTKTAPLVFAISDGARAEAEGGKTVSLSFAPTSPARNLVEPPSPWSLVANDWNYDFQNDIALANSDGLRLYQATSPTAFVDVSARAKLPESITKASYYGAWPADTESDGDLDLVLAPRTGKPFVARNNGDGSWIPLQPFTGIENARGFAWSDLDSDGDADAVFLDDKGALHFFSDERAGVFKEWPAPDLKTKIGAITIADSDSDGAMDVVALGDDGAVSRISYVARGSEEKSDGAWKITEIGAAQGAGRASSPRMSTHVRACDLDNNGAIDIVASQNGQTRVWLQDGEGWKALEKPLDATITGSVDLDGDGRLDLVGVDSKGAPLQWKNSGDKAYHWLVLRPVAAESGGSGDHRINSFGVGGTIEMRSGLLFQKQPIEGPLVHFGLGENTLGDYARIIWPNGQVQVECELKGDAALVAIQRLTGSCPWLWAFNGRDMKFIKDCLWRSPLGLRINAQDTAGVIQTGDWALIRQSQLKPRDGFYDLRVTADLWEAHFFDQAALLAVDHPNGTQAWVDERFSVPMPPPGVTITQTAQPIASARDDRNRDVSDVVADLDARYLDSFGRGQYQGVTRDHFVEIELPLWARDARYLIAEGWLYPTDSSINTALGQGRHAPPRDLSLEVADGKGNWRVARAHLGFPAGKNKAILVDLKKVFAPGAPLKLRLRTNLEIYWDKISWARAASPGQMAQVKQHQLEASTADLRFRGVSRVVRANRSSPEVPLDYRKEVSTTPQWNDLIGYYTRFGDVRPLLKKIDDRYVIMNSGDEMALRFKALPAVAQGWQRDFVFFSDGWTKDGNLNTAHSKVVLPLPSHARPAYSSPPTALRDDPVYQAHRDDWRTYQTRYITTRRFRQTLKPKTEIAAAR